MVHPPAMLPMASMRNSFKRLLVRARNTSEQDVKDANAKEGTTTCVRTSSGAVRMFTSAKGQGKCTTCQFDPSSNVMPIFSERPNLERRSESKRYKVFYKPLVRGGSYLVLVAQCSGIHFDVRSRI